MRRMSLFLVCLGLLSLGGCSDDGGGNGGAGGVGGGGSGGTGGAGGGTGGTGGQTECTEIGCSDGFTFTIKAGGDGTFADGEYTLATEVDGQMETCTVTIGAATSTTCSDATVDVMNKPNQILVTFPGTPENLHIVLTLAGANLFDVELMDPSYSEVQPNGPGCPPVCTQAQGSVTL